MVHYELLHGAECLLKDGYLLSQICYKYLLKEAVCSDALLKDSDANCSRIDTEKGYITLPRYHKYCVAAGISGLNRDSLSLMIPANEGIPTGQPRNLAVHVAPNSMIRAQWTAPPFEEWKGIPEMFSVNVSVDQRLINSTNIPVQSLSDYETSFPLNEEGDNYTVTVSSCTSVGCGPSAEKTIFSECRSRLTCMYVLHMLHNKSKNIDVEVPKRIETSCSMQTMVACNNSL